MDRFRTAVNVSGDMFAAKVLEKITKIKDDPNEFSEEEEVGQVGSVHDNVHHDNAHRV